MKHGTTPARLHRELGYLLLRIRVLAAQASSYVTRWQMLLILTGAVLLLGFAAVLLLSRTTHPTAPLPTPHRPPAHVMSPLPAPRPPNEQTVVVAAGDTLAALAVRYGVPSEQLATDNALGDPNRIYPGQRLHIGTRPTDVEVIEPGSTLCGYARELGTTVARLRQLNPDIVDPDRIQAGGVLRIR